MNLVRKSQQTSEQRLFKQLAKISLRMLAVRLSKILVDKSERKYLSKELKDSARATSVISWEDKL
jgi:ssRNA-specific RNase YbeY (16S rRNA maturation enzyme)